VIFVVVVAYNMTGGVNLAIIHVANVIASVHIIITNVDFAIANIGSGVLTYNLCHRVY
jgi:hypothetical protein